jgi:hypothetical protein
MIHHPFIHSIHPIWFIHPLWLACREEAIQYLRLLKLKPFRKEMTGRFLGSWSER